MKKLILICLLVSAVYTVYSQRGDKTWFNVTFKSGFGSSLWINNNFIDDDNIKYKNFNVCYPLAGQVGINFDNGFGVAVEVMSTHHGQKFEITPEQPFTPYEKKLVIKSFDQLVLIRSVGEKGGYFEAGPRLSQVKNLIIENEPDQNNASELGSIDDYQDTNIGILFGFGGSFYFHDLYDISFGLRVNYTISNIMEGEEYPIKDAIYNPDFGLYATTNPLIVQLVLSLSWHFRYVDSSKTSLE